jgi:hypothetical protein
MLAKATPQAASYNPFAAAIDGPIPSLASNSKGDGGAAEGGDSSSSKATAAASSNSRLSRKQVEALVKADAGEACCWFHALALALLYRCCSDGSCGVCVATRLWRCC